MTNRRRKPCPNVIKDRRKAFIAVSLVHVFDLDVIGFLVPLIFSVVLVPMSLLHIRLFHVHAFTTA